MNGAPKMEVRNVKVSPKTDLCANERMEFDLLNVDNSFANGLRRIMLSEIPTLAIDKVTIKANTSVFFDEMLVHRLALIPWDSMTARDWDDNDEEKFDFTVRCESDQHSRKVTTLDLPPVFRKGDPSNPINPVATDQGIWLLTLGRGQEFSCRCVIKRGIAKLHSKWMAVSTVAMRYAADIRLNPRGFAMLSEENRRLWVSRCPVNVFSLNDATKEVDMVNVDACIFCKECLTFDAPFDKGTAPLVSMKQKKNSYGQFDFHFTVESTGQLPAVEVLRQAVFVLRGKLQDIQNSLTDSLMGNPGGMNTRPIGTAPTTAIVVNEDQQPKPGGGKDDDLSHLQH